MTSWEIHRDREGFRRLAPEWRDCLETMPGANPFLTHAWIDAWLGAHGARVAPRICVLRREGRLVAAAPLGLVRDRYYGIPVKALIWLGSHTSDRVRFLVRDGEPVLAQELWRRVLELDDRPDLIRLEQVPTPSLTEETILGTGGLLGREECAVLPWVSVTDWDAFEKSIPRKFRSELRTRVKVFDSWGDWSFGVVEGDAVADWLPRLADLESASAKSLGGYAFLEDTSNRQLLADMCSSTGAGAEAILFRLEVGDTLVAYLLGFVHGESLCAYNMAYRPGYEKGSPGKWLLHEAMRWAHERGLSEFDFLRGANYLKSRWRPAERRNCRLVRFRRNPLGLALHTAVFRARPWMKGLRNRSRDRSDPPS